MCWYNFCFNKERSLEVIKHNERRLDSSNDVGIESYRVGKWEWWNKYTNRETPGEADQWHDLLLIFCTEHRDFGKTPIHSSFRRPNHQQQIQQDSTSLRIFAQKQLTHSDEWKLCFMWLTNVLNECVCVWVNEACSRRSSEGSTRYKGAIEAIWAT